MVNSGAGICGRGIVMLVITSPGKFSGTGVKEKGTDDWEVKPTGADWQELAA